jgi:peptidase M28-like protein
VRRAGLLLLGAALACGGSPPPPLPPAPDPAPANAVTHRADGERLFDVVRTLSSPEYGGRRTGSEGGRLTRQWLVERFQAAGLKPVDADYLLPFEFTHYSVRGVFEKDRPFRTRFRDAANVAGTLDGRAPAARTIVVSAHYDHLGTPGGQLYPGADDNASGVAVLLEAARWFAADPPRHPMLFVAFDAEEMGLKGSEAFVDHPPLGRERIAIDVNFDMVSRNDRNEIYAAGPTRYPFLRPILDEVRQHSAVKIEYGHDRPGTGADDWTDQSDQGPFAEAGIPFLYFGVEDHADYHRPSDTADKIDPAFFTGVADMVLEALDRLDQTLPD